MTSATPRAAAVDPAADFRDWVAPHLLAMGRLAARLSSDAASDDVVQESLVRAWRRRSTFDPSRGSTSSWLLAIVADQARRHRTRARRPDIALLNASSHPDVRSGAGGPGSVDQAVDLERAIRALAPRQRLAVELHHLLGLPVAECAEVMACSAGTVKSTLSDARARLRAALEETP